MSAAPGPRSSVIDLGVLPPTGDPDFGLAPADRPAGAARGRPHWWKAAVVAGLVVLALGGSAPDLSWLRSHFSVPAGVEGRFFLAGGSLYVLEQDPAGRRTLVSYRLSGGETRWRVASHDAYLYHDLPIVVDEVGQASWLDPATGEVTGSASGYVSMVTDRLVVFARPGSDTGLEGMWDNTLTALDRLTGEVVWQRSGVHTWNGTWPGPANPEHLVAIDRHAIASYDFATGVQLRAHPLPATDLDDLAHLPLPLAVSVIGEVVLASLPDGLAAFDRATLSPLWTVPHPEAPYFPGDCSGVICAQAGDTLRALDPVTGRPTWSAPLGRDDHYGYGPPAPAGYFVSLTDAGMALHDSATGELVWAADGWLPYVAAGRPDSLLLSRYHENRPPEVERTGPNRQRIVAAVAGQTWFARLLVDPPRLEVLGAAPSGRAGCLVEAGHIACQDREEIRVWRVR